MADYSGAYGAGDSFPYGPPIKPMIPSPTHGFINTPGMHHIDELRAANRALEARVAALEAMVARERARGKHREKLVNELDNKTRAVRCEHGTLEGFFCRQCSYNYPG